MSRTRIVCDLHKVVLSVCGCSHPAVTTLPVTFIPIEDVEKENKTAESTEVLNVTVGSGKYTVIQDRDGRLRALRYGEEWRDCVGDGLVYTMAAEIQELREENAKLREAAIMAARKHDPEIGDNAMITTME